MILVQKRVWYDFCFHYATVEALKHKYHKSGKWVRNRLANFVRIPRGTKPRKMVAIMDATRIGSRWLFVVRDPNRRENVYAKEIFSESTSCYQAAIEFLDRAGFEIIAIVGDGKIAISWLFKDIPVQMCHFRQKQIVIRYITLRPILEAGKELLSIMNLLTMSTEKEFTLLFERWCEKWKLFLNEKSVDEKGKTTGYTHRSLRSARGSVKRHLPYLFTYLRYPELHIPNTTNSLDGSFGKIKNAIAVHAGLSQKLKMKMVETLLGGKVSASQKYH